MDKNTIIGIVLMIGIFVGFSFYQSNEMQEQQEIAKEKAKVEQRERAMRVAETEAERMLEEAMSEEERIARDSIAEVERTNVEVARHGATLYAARTGVVKQEVVANDYMTVTFDNRGGKIVDVALNDYTRYAEGERTELVHLMVPESMCLGLNLRRGDAILNTNNYFFAPKVEELEDRTIVTMTLAIDRDAWVEYVYTVHRTGDKSRDYVVDFSLKQHNIDAMLSNRDQIVLTWQNKSNKNERSFRNESMATTIEYFVDDDVEDLDSDGELEKESGIEWVAFKQQYFSSALISENPITAAMSFNSAKRESDGYIKDFSTEIIIPHVAGRELYNFAFYYGPNDYKVMKNVEFMGRECELQQIIPLIDAKDRELAFAQLNGAFNSNDIILAEENALCDGETLDNSPGAVWKLRPGMMGKVARLGNGAGAQSSLYSGSAYWQSLIEGTTGNFEVNQGKEPSNVTTATGIALLNERAESRKSIKNIDRNEGFKRLYSILDKMALEFYNDGRIIRMGLSGEDEFVFNFGGFVKKTRDEAYIPSLDITINVGSSVNNSKSFTLSALTTLMNMKITEDNYRFVKAYVQNIGIPQRDAICDYLDEKFGNENKGQIDESLLVKLLLDEKENKDNE